MKEKNYSEAIANAIKSYLEEDDWRFSFDNASGIFRFGLSLSNKIKKINYIVDVKVDEYIVYAVVPIGVDEGDEKTMAVMAEFVCRANYGLKNGNLEFDMDDGLIRYKCYVDCENAIPSEDIVQNSIHCPLPCSTATARESLISSLAMSLRKKRLKSAIKQRKKRCVLS